MAKLVLTAVGEDRAGLVRSLADAVNAHGGNWETSELAELAGVFAGVILVSVPDDRVDALRGDLAGVAGLQVTPHVGTDVPVRHGVQMEFSVLGNDHPGIVREISDTLARHRLTIDHLTSRTIDAPMSGGTLFEATVRVRPLEGADLEAAVVDLERLAGEIQVDLTVA
ncbi:amino acid-binding ACT protein [Microbacterium mangrovi]|uniref:Amino acid-binding ACT protein n=1 Tax=Microbacterium mangrovi TaxID=1348253 RepID=A0A0B2A2U6_9MICO|nr:ACT domain-containing protein [Microbacterium mangrovi]KHK97360.1 amino acid-binding ACT protein [Microbacterium mangrovi]